MPCDDNGNKELETWLWDAACSIRGAIEAPRYKDFILPLIFLKRVSDVFDDELKLLNENIDVSEELIKGCPLMPY